MLVTKLGLCLDIAWSYKLKIQCKAYKKLQIKGLSAI